MSDTVRIDSLISKLSDAKFSIPHYIPLVRGCKENIYFNHSWVMASLGCFERVRLLLWATQVCQPDVLMLGFFLHFLCGHTSSIM